MDQAAVKVEPMNESEIKALVEFWKSVPGVGVGEGDDERSIRDFIRRNPESSLVLKENGELIGTVLGGYDGRRGYIYHLAIRPDQRKKGYGEMLLNQAVDNLRQQGAQKITLLVYKDNDLGLGFYRNMGWLEREDVIAFSLIDGCDSCCSC